jgi:hypothetical protein
MDGDERVTIEQLEAANAELRRVNARLAREKLGKANSAAASLLAKVEAEREELARRLGELPSGDPVADERRALIRRVEELHQQVLAQEHELRELKRMRLWRVSSRYHSIKALLLRKKTGRAAS